VETVDDAVEELGIFGGSKNCGRPTGALCRKDGVRGWISTGNTSPEIQ